jgi:hypothetical protein
MKFRLRHLCWALAIAPPFLAGFWWYGPGALDELRMRMARDAVEVSPPAELAKRLEREAAESASD